MSSALEIFEAESRKFELRLTEKERAEFRSTSLEDVKTTIMQTQHSQVSTKNLMDSSRLKQFLEGMEQSALVIEVFANSSIYVGFVWGPIKFLLLAARHWTDSYDTLLDAYKDIGECLPQLEGFGHIFSSDLQMQCYLAWIYADILKFHRAAHRWFQGPST